MLIVKEFKSWFDFEEEIHNLLREQRQTLVEMMGPPYFFRGQSNATWHLETSLERYLGPKISMSGYYSMINEIRPRIEAFTDKKWDLPSLQTYTASLKSRDQVKSEYQVYEYMAYLRHHGFPSPLLDWSYSPYVAAFFAFRDIASDAKSVAVFAYTIPNRGDIPLPNEPRIFIHWSEELRTNKRHYLQQSVYTTCVVQDKDNLYYTSHENLYSREYAEGGEYLTKYVLPSSERGRALSSLEVYNINAYSLFGTEESLLETMFARRYAIKKRNEETESLYKIKD